MHTFYENLVTRTYTMWAWPDIIWNGRKLN